MAFLVGVHDHFKYTRSKYKCEWYAHCFDLLDATAMKFITRTALASHCTDPLHAMVLADDRIGKNPAQYFAALHDQLRFLNQDLPELLYTRLSSVTGVLSHELESWTLASAYHAASFIDYKVFSVARQPLFRLCSAGSIADEISALGQVGNPYIIFQFGFAIDIALPKSCFMSCVRSCYNISPFIFDMFGFVIILALSYN